tara:strand:- start:2167 stop:2724 length:558 start_codon:yes stop_codon:yes gene_type:complete
MATTTALVSSVSTNSVAASKWQAEDLTFNDGFALNGQTADIAFNAFSGLSVSSGATVNGITITAFGQGNPASNKPQLRVYNPGTRTFSSGKDCNSTLSKSNAVVTWGGSSDLWGISWTDTQAVAIRAIFMTSTIGGGGTVFYDYFKVTIDFTLAGYGHDVIGVASSDITSINGVPTGDISNIIGV